MLHVPRNLQNCRISTLSSLKLFRSFSTLKLPDRLDFSKLSDKEIGVFERILGKNNVIQEDLDNYNVDFMKWYKGKTIFYYLNLFHNKRIFFTKRET